MKNDERWLGERVPKSVGELLKGSIDCILKKISGVNAVRALM